MNLPLSFQRTITDLFQDRGRSWLAALPQLIADLEQKWSFQALPHVSNLSYNYVAPVVLADRSSAILKLGVPVQPLSDEAAALRIYNGQAICQLLQADMALGAMLIERLHPGTSLAEVEDDQYATQIAAELMSQLWRPLPENHGFVTVVDWSKGLQRLRAEFDGGTGPFPARTVEKAERLFADLLASSGLLMLLHGDLHHDNILRAERRPWLAIDPKGIAGEAAYEVGALLRNPGDRIARAANPGQMIERRVAILAEVLEMDAQRIAGWGYAQVVLSAWWTYEDHHQYQQDWLVYADALDPLVY